MTAIVVVLIGIGVVFIASSLDCTPIKDTFTAIVTNQPIDWTGTKNCQANIPQQGSSATIGAGTQGRLINPNPDGTCPSGYTKVTVSGGKIQCESNTIPRSTATTPSVNTCPQGYVFDSYQGKCIKLYRSAGGTPGQK